MSNEAKLRPRKPRTEKSRRKRKAARTEYLIKQAEERFRQAKNSPLLKK